jgi:type II secretory pathway component PulC
VALCNRFSGERTGGEMKKFYKITLILISIAASISAGIVLVEPGVALGQSRKKAELLTEGRKDPFFLPSGVRLLSKEIPVQEDKKFQPIAEIKPNEIKPVEPSLKLKAILIGDHVRLASIDRSIVSIGDFINGEKVLEIRSDLVILEKEGKKRTLVLDQSPIKLTVEER